MAGALPRRTAAAWLALAALVWIAAHAWRIFFAPVNALLRNGR